MAALILLPLLQGGLPGAAQRMGVYTRIAGVEHEGAPVYHRMMTKVKSPDWTRREVHYVLARQTITVPGPPTTHWMIGTANNWLGPPAPLEFTSISMEAIGPPIDVDTPNEGICVGISPETAEGPWRLLLFVAPPGEEDEQMGETKANLVHAAGEGSST
eukprot:3542932-Prymnesium_polylepis.1